MFEYTLYFIISKLNIELKNENNAYNMYVMLYLTRFYEFTSQYF